VEEPVLKLRARIARERKKVRNPASTARLEELKDDRAPGKLRVIPAAARRRLTSVPDRPTQRCQLRDEVRPIIKRQRPALALDGVPQSQQHDTVAQTLSSPPTEGRHRPVANGRGGGICHLICQSRGNGSGDSR